MGEKTIQTRNAVFWSIIAIFATIVISIASRGRLLGHKPALIVSFSLMIIFSVLAVILVVLTMRIKEAVIRKLLFIVTGASAAGILVFVILHNLVFAFCVKYNCIYWSGEDEPVLFCLALFVCPALFLVGALGSIVTLIYGKKKT